MRQVVVVEDAQGRGLGRRLMEAIEAVATIIALGGKFIPQTLNFRGRDPECDLEYCHNGPIPSGSDIAISNSFAFGGNITSLVLAR